LWLILTLGATNVTASQICDVNIKQFNLHWRSWIRQPNPQNIISLPYTTGLLDHIYVTLWALLRVLGAIETNILICFDEW
jgi:hypothetical protein